VLTQSHYWERRRTPAVDERALRWSDLALNDREDVASGEHEVLDPVVLDFGSAVLRVQDDIADGDIERNAVAVVINAAGASCGFSLAESGMTIPEAVTCSAASC
jgi:hypothetical protein